MNNNQTTPEVTFTVRHYTESEKLRRIAAEKQKIAMDEFRKISVAKDEGRAEAISETTKMFIANLRAMGMSEAQIKMALGKPQPLQFIPCPKQFLRSAIQRLNPKF